LLASVACWFGALLSPQHRTAKPLANSAAEIETEDGMKSVIRAGDFALFADTAGEG